MNTEGMFCENGICVCGNGCEWITCPTCESLIPIEQCVEVQPGMLTHETWNGRIHAL